MAHEPKVAGIVGWHDSGKTTLLVALVGELTARGHTVSTVKHAHHAFDVDTPGKDSWRHREAGAREVMVGSGQRWALMHELRGTPEPDLDALLAKMSPVDLILVEGFKTAGHEKIEVYRRSVAEPPLVHSAPNVVAMAADSPVADRPAAVAHLDIDDVAGIADFIERHWRLEPRPRAESA